MIAAVSVRHREYVDVEKAIATALEEVDNGLHDTELAKAGHPRPTGVTLKGRVVVTQNQGLSTEEWLRIMVDFGPLAATIAESIWNIVVVPKLKKIFHQDGVKDSNPSESHKHC
jgi:hypothetical protein